MPTSSWFLLPGPRDRDGLPESLRFWKTRIESSDADSTFRVGLIYGPSGCGKSSLVKAGLLPRLSKLPRTSPNRLPGRCRPRHLGGAGCRKRRAGIGGLEPRVGTRRTTDRADVARSCRGPGPVPPGPARCRRIARGTARRRAEGPDIRWGRTASYRNHRPAWLSQIVPRKCVGGQPPCNSSATTCVLLVPSVNEADRIVMGPRPVHAWRCQMATARQYRLRRSR